MRGHRVCGRVPPARSRKCSAASLPCIRVQTSSVNYASGMGGSRSFPSRRAAPALRWYLWFPEEDRRPCSKKALPPPIARDLQLSQGQSPSDLGRAAAWCNTPPKPSDHLVELKANSGRRSELCCLFVLASKVSDLKICLSANKRSYFVGDRSTTSATEARCNSVSNECLRSPLNASRSRPLTKESYSTLMSLFSV